MPGPAPWAPSVLSEPDGWRVQPQGRGLPAPAWHLRLRRALASVAQKVVTLCFNPLLLGSGPSRFSVGWRGGRERLVCACVRAQVAGIDGQSAGC